ncbi:uncharacterized protein E5676_scaffold587G00420 [Cucumis melo var. makuwa]|uniref:MULE transposase domain-containing protein n=1 Tax=Cucumis melo var. makuwa TaxID=1194695 RepID=A0A5D3E377_CUCMM|nr:uncharacterized protein E5676_scaffold587G00420 [Cucumis melo var. makuwa]
MSVEIQNIVRANPSVIVLVLVEMIKQQYGYTVKDRRVWQAKRKALVAVFGDWEKLDNNLWKSFLGIWSCNRRVQILGHIFPLAFAIVEGENTSNWLEFLYALRQYVTNRDGICLISDRHRVILAAINNEEIGWSKPQAFHRYCLRHVASNFNNKYKSKQLKILVFRVDDQHQRHKFIRTMKELKKLNPECLEYFEDIDLQKWTQSHDNRYQYGWMTSNAAECMNGVFKGACDPYITQHMRYLLHYRVELSEERGSVSMHHPLRPVHCTLLRCCWIPKGLPGCCSAVRVASGWGASDRIIEFQELPPDADVVGTYAWDAMTLAWLYRKLYHASYVQSLEIAGPLMLLQVWHTTDSPLQRHRDRYSI